MASDRQLERRQWIARVLSSVVFVPFGLFHCLASQSFLSIMPPQIPYPREVIVVTGLAEIAGGIGILSPWTRKAAGIGLALYAICVYPANVYHALAHKHVPPLPDSWWYHGPRLAAQPIFIWWALFAGGLIAWPWRKSDE